jgi:hypothetical protein
MTPLKYPNRQKFDAGVDGITATGAGRRPQDVQKAIGLDRVSFSMRTSLADLPRAEVRHRCTLDTKSSQSGG